jgi:thiamine transport system permease protein
LRPSLLAAVVWEAALRSVIVVALGSTALAVALALPIALFAARGRGMGRDVAALSISVSPLVMGTGLFLILFPVADPVALALPVTGLVNALVALPFILRGLIPEVREAEATQGRLADALGLTGWSRLRLAILPRLRRPLGFGAGLAAAFSMGDLGVIALFLRPGAGDAADGDVPADGVLPHGRRGGGGGAPDAAGAGAVLAVRPGRARRCCA